MGNWSNSTSIDVVRRGSWVMVMGLRKNEKMSDVSHLHVASRRRGQIVIGWRFFGESNPEFTIDNMSVSEPIDLTDADDGIPAIVPLASRSAAVGRSVDPDRMPSEDDDDDTKFTALLANPALASVVQKPVALYPGAITTTAIDSSRHSATRAMALRQTNMITPRLGEDVVEPAAVQQDANVATPLVPRVVDFVSTSGTVEDAATEELGHVNFTIQLPSVETRTLVTQGKELRLEPHEVSITHTSGCPSFLVVDT
jgi:hypothetical protein